MSNLPFNKQAEQHQINWRKSQIDLPVENGTQNGVTYEHILPSDKWLFGVWEEIRIPLSNYIETEQIQANTGKHNLKSSWTQCANTFFPFRVNPSMEAMLVSFLNRELNLNVSSIAGLEFEYAAPGKLSPEILLGEMKGMRGSGQTSPDVAILFKCPDSKCGLYLIENKYTENHFYPCSAAQKTVSPAHSQQGLEPNPNPERCKNIQALLENPEDICHQLSWGRQYWSLLKNHANTKNLLKLPYCPAMRDGYQLFRQQALAQGISDAGLFDYVVSGVAYDDRNTELVQCLAGIGINKFDEEWGNLFNQNSKVIFHCFSHQKFVSWIKRSKSPYITAWGDYLHERYGF
jgi:hypothetical protein